MKTRNTKALNTLLSLAAGALLLSASATVAHAESLSFAGIGWNDDKDTIFQKLEKNGLAPGYTDDKFFLTARNPVSSCLEGLYAVIGIPKINDFCESMVKNLERSKIDSLVSPYIKIFTLSSKHKNKVVKDFNLNISDVGNKVPLNYDIIIEPSSISDTLDVLTKKYGEFQKATDGKYHKNCKYMESGNEFLIYYERGSDKTRSYYLHYANLDNLRAYIPLKLEQVRAANQAEDEAKKKEVKSLF